MTGLEMKDVLLGMTAVGLTGLLLLGSCDLLNEKREVNEQESDSTYFRATLNDQEEWSADPRGVFVDNGGKFDHMLSISGDTIHQNSFPYTENLIIFVNYHGKGRYNISGKKFIVNGSPLITGSSYAELDGDVLISEYHPIDDTTANQMTVTTYDSTTGTVGGTFRTTVVVDSADRESEPGEPPRRRPDTLRFTNGKFRVKVEDQR